jgi:hypothetical protein
VIADPQSRRGRRWAELGIPLIAWTEVLAGTAELPQGRVRLESPGARPEMVEAVLGLGGLSYRPGSPEEMIPLDAWYRGFCALLDRLPPADTTHPPAEVALQFDKQATRERLQAAGVPVVEGALATSAEQVQRRARQQLAILKPRYGSSASGIVVLASQRATTTVHWREGLPVFGRLHPVGGEELADTLSWVLAGGAVLEPLLPHLRIDGLCCDFRVIVHRDEVLAVIPRLSRHTVTNLQLGGRRGDPERIRAQLGMRAWLDLRDAALLAARCFACETVGVDVLLDPARRPRVLELNPFGDHFPGWRLPDGRTLEQAVSA